MHLHQPFPTDFYTCLLFHLHLPQSTLELWFFNDRDQSRIAWQAFQIPHRLWSLPTPSKPEAEPQETEPVFGKGSHIVHTHP